MNHLPHNDHFNISVISVINFLMGNEISVSRGMLLMLIRVAN